MDAPTPTPTPPPSPSPNPIPVSSGPVGGKPDTVARFLAFLIDAVAVAAVGLVPVIGGLVGIAYVLTRDGLAFDFMDGRSIGKKLMKLRPVRLDGQPMDLNTSVMRNWPLSLGSLAQVLIFIPVIGWILILTAGLTAYYTFRVFFRVFMGPVEYHPGDEVHDHDHADAHGDDHAAHAAPAAAAGPGGGIMPVQTGPATGPCSRGRFLAD